MLTALRSTLKNNKGFTLVELMIVVAIIGILAAIAVPNYQKYQSKARQAEVKLNLSTAHTALQSFMVENSTYTGCLANIGVAVGSAAEKRYYSFGIDDASTGAANCGPAGGVACTTFSGFGTATPATCTAGLLTNRFDQTTQAAGSAAAPSTGIANAAGAGKAYSLVNSAKFTLGATGSIGGAVSDNWTMDQDKIMVNTQSGI